MIRRWRKFDEIKERDREREKKKKVFSLVANSNKYKHLWI